MAKPISIKIPLNGDSVIEIFLKKDVNLENVSQRELELITQVIETLILNSLSSEENE